jgi:SAM-dependent methyltransferase
VNHNDDLGRAQQAHWQSVYRQHPGMYGHQPSSSAVAAAQAFHAAGARSVLELGAGHGRDALYFARAGFTVHATDFSPTALDQLTTTATTQDLTELITVTAHDVRDPLPFPDSSFDAVFAHMLLCMAISTTEIHRTISEASRVLRPHGTLVYTVRHTSDAHYRAGIDHGDNIWEHSGFAVHFFDRALVDTLAKGWDLADVHAFDEGALPRRLWRITQRKRHSSSAV